MPSRLRPYLKYSLAIHAVMLGILIIASWWTPERKSERMKFVVLSKGTSRNAVPRPHRLEQTQLQPEDPRITRPPETKRQKATPEPSPQVRDTTVRDKSPIPNPEPQGTPQPTRAAATPAPGKHAATLPPVTTETPRPSPAPVQTPEPKVSPASRATPRKTARPGTPTPKPPAKTPAAQKRPTTKAKAKATPKSSAPPKATPRPTASAYDQPNAKPDRQAKDPRKTPAGGTIQSKALSGGEAGAPGLAKGVEGAPLSLTDEQSPLPPVYSNRATMLLGRHFRVPPEMNEPEMICIVEWDILPDGTFRNIEVVKSTGTDEYDRLALEAVNAVGRLDPLPLQFRGRTLRVSYPFVYGF